VKKVWCGVVGVWLLLLLLLLLLLSLPHGRPVLTTGGVRRGSMKGHASRTEPAWHTHTRTRTHTQHVRGHALVLARHSHMGLIDAQAARLAGLGVAPVLGEWVGLVWRGVSVPRKGARTRAEAAARTPAPPPARPIAVHSVSLKATHQRCFSPRGGSQ
jgi:hypothetical protein